MRLSFLVIPFLALPAATGEGKRPSALVAAVNKIKPALVTVQPVEKEKKRPPGRGVIVDRKGVILVPLETVRGAAALEVVLDDGSKLAAKVVRAEEKAGVAILKVESTKPLPAAEFGDSDKVELTDFVLALSGGHEFPSVVVGMISAKDKALPSGEKVMVVDSSVSTGLGAGVLIDVKGRLIGLLPDARVAHALPSNRLVELLAR